VSSAADASAQAAAEALFLQARELMAAGKYDLACARFEESQRLDPGAGTLLNLATCYEKRGQTASAWATYNEAAALSNQTHRPEWEQMARSHADRLEPLLSTLTISVPVDHVVPDLRVERDGLLVDRAQWGVPIPVDPGERVVTASAPSKQPWRSVVVVGSGAAKESVVIPLLAEVQHADTAKPPVSVAPKPPVTLPPASGATDQGIDDGAGQRTAGLIVGGVGVAGLAVGSYLGLSARSKYHSALAYCDANDECYPEGLSLNDEARQRAKVSTVLFGVGAAAALAGGVLYFTASDSSRGSVALGAAPTPTGGAISVRGMW